MHKEKIDHLRQTFLDQKKAGCFSLKKNKSSNSLRQGDYKKAGPQLDLRCFNEVIEIDVVNKIAVIEPRVTMEALFKKTAKLNLVPKVVPEFKGITAGGAVNGAAIESSSFRFGQFNDTCLEYEVLLGTGEVIRVSKDNHPELFYGISGSYGSLGIITSLKVSLTEAKPFVHLEYRLTESVAIAVKKMEFLAKDQKVDFLEAIVYSKDQVLIIIGTMTESKEHRALFDMSKTYSPWYYLHLKECLEKGISDEVVTLEDYIFRHDRGAFWMGGYALNFKILSSYLLKLVGVKSSPNKGDLATPLKNAPFLFRWLFGWMMGSKTLYKILHSATEDWFKEHFCIQDYYLPKEEVESFTGNVLDSYKIAPLWICPVRTTETPQILSPHYSAKETLLFDVGVYGKPAGHLGCEAVATLDRLCYRSCGKKMFYSHTAMQEDEFWKHYPLDAYQTLRKNYKAYSFHSVTTKILN